ncbi:MAG: hypothetical protein LBK05_04690 [Treponema sp.]|jgi:hypothetical protein|nr:hypothetical protein [Treponema sp.]
MKKRYAVLVLALVLVSPALLLSAQEDDGFGFGGGEEDGDFGFGPDSGGAGAASPGAPLIGAKIGGKVSAGLTFFPDDFLAKGGESALDRTKKVELHDIFSGELKFSAEASNADAVINLKLAPNFKEPSEILLLDEAYVRAFFGRLIFEGGLRKLTWGRADSFGPLDLTNPFDYSDLSGMTDFSAIKIARPMLRASWGIGMFSKIEGVFVPWFEADRFAEQGRWRPAQLRRAEQIPSQLVEKLTSDLTPFFLSGEADPGRIGELMNLMGSMSQSDPLFSSFNKLVPDTSALEYFQGGLRFTTTLGPADFGAQYYYGLHPRPSYRLSPAGYGNLMQAIKDYAKLSDADAQQDGMAAIKAAMDPLALLDIAYNRYHHIGVDYAQVLFGFNVRAELAANITGDLSGDDGFVYNPALLWSLGFDRDIPVVRINANLQVNEKITLLHNRLGSDPLLDIEAGSKMTSTRVTLRLSRSFFRDELELQATAIWGIEDKDCYLIPSVTWTKGDLSLEVSGGIFAGDRDGELGQYRDNYFIKTLLSYSF